MASFRLSNSNNCSLREVRDCLLYEAGGECHAGDFDEELRGEEINGIFTEAKVVSTGSRLDGVIGNRVLEHAHVAGFDVADLLDAVVGAVWETEVGERRSIEDFNRLLVEVEDGPFRG